MSKGKDDRRRQCSECPRTYELIPPPDVWYSIPREAKPANDKFLKRVYECENGHLNTVYWCSPSPGVVVSGSFETGIPEVDNKEWMWK